MCHHRDDPSGIHISAETLLCPFLKPQFCVAQLNICKIHRRLSSSKLLRMAITRHLHLYIGRLRLPVQPSPYPIYSPRFEQCGGLVNLRHASRYTEQAPHKGRQRQRQEHNGPSFLLDRTGGRGHLTFTLTMPRRIFQHWSRLKVSE